MARPLRRGDPRPTQETGLLLRLPPHPVHHGRGPLPRRPDGVRRTPSAGLHLPGEAGGQLVPGGPDRAFRRRSGDRPGGRAGASLEHRLPARRRSGDPVDRRHHPPGDPVRGCGGGGPSGGPAVPRLRRPVGPASADGPGDPGDRRRGRGSRVRDRLSQDHPGARPARLRNRAAARADPDRGHARGRRPERGGPGAVPGARPLPRPGGGGRRARSGGAPRGDRGPAGAARPRPALRGAHRVPALRPVVRADGAARGAGAPAERLRAPGGRGMGEGARGRPALPSAALGAGVRPVADGDPRLDDQSADLVGAPDPGLAPPGDRGDPGRGGSAGSGAGGAGRVAAGRGCAGHLVQQLALADEHPRLAGADPGLRALLPDFAPLHRQGDPVLLGGADELRRDRDDRPAALRGCVHPPDGARRARRGDEQEQGERGGPAGGDLRGDAGGVEAAGGRGPADEPGGDAPADRARFPGGLRGRRRGRAPVHAGAAVLRGAGDAARALQVPRDRAAVPHQVVERLPVRAVGGRGGRSGRGDGGAGRRGPVDRLPRRRLRRGGAGGARGVRLRRGGVAPLPVRLERLL